MMSHSLFMILINLRVVGQRRRSRKSTGNDQWYMFIYRKIQFREYNQIVLLSERIYKIAFSLDYSIISSRHLGLVHLILSPRNQL